MKADKEFILTIQLYPELYKAYKRRFEDDEENRLTNLWTQFAKENNLKSGLAAEMKWRQLVSKYISFLLYGLPFSYEREMQFMQMNLLGQERLSDDAQSDSEIDVEELKNILNSYDDISAENEIQSIAAKDNNVESKNDNAKRKMQNSDELHKDQKCELLIAEESSEVQDNSGSLKSYHNDGETKNRNNKRKRHSNDELNKAKSKKKSELVNDEESNKIQNNSMSLKCGSNQESMLPKQCKKPIAMPITADTTTDISTTPNLQANTCNINTPSGDINNSGGFTNLSSLELIFLGYAKVLQRMPLRLQLQIKRKIADIMDEAELHLFEGNS
uniref:MADF domain-containing protein n=1 Tax=Ceratitis capitata TaxID=7213 RepID=W8CE53_CERCA